ncbi:hypothetical protein HYV86_00215 [Candidatus Woesearchaeota archaeon]|nr:hypothetical protein [Candidatus Woesearchaeota archaeon]
MKFITDERSIGWGEYVAEAIGHVILIPQNPIEYNQREYAKSLIAGCVIADWDLGKFTDWQLWITRIAMQPVHRRRPKEYYEGRRVDQILTSDWTNPDHWGDEKEVTTMQGAAHLIVGDGGDICVNPDAKCFEDDDGCFDDDRYKNLNVYLQGHRKYMIAGSIIGGSLEGVEHHELWSGKLFFFPHKRYTWANAPDERQKNAMSDRRIDQWLVSQVLTNETFWGEPIGRYNQRIPQEQFLERTSVLERNPISEFMKKIGWE